MTALLPQYDCTGKKFDELISGKPMKESNNGSNNTFNPDDEAPELTDDFFQYAELRKGAEVIRVGRPRSEFLISGYKNKDL